MSGYDNTNSGALFKNEKRHNENSPTLRGSCEPVCPHCGKKSKFWVSAWKKIAKSGSTFISLAFTADDENTNKPQPAKPDFDDDIPF